MEKEDEGCNQIQQHIPKSYGWHLSVIPKGESRMKTILAIVIAGSIAAIAMAQDGIATMPMLKALPALTTMPMPKAAPAATLYIAPTLPGTSIQDFAKPGLIVTRRSDGNSFVAPTTPGTPFQDFTKPGYIIESQ